MVQRLEFDKVAGKFLVDGKLTEVEDIPLDLILDSGWEPATFRRNAYVYEQCMLNIPYGSIRRAIKNHPGWEPIGSDSGIRRTADIFAKRYGLPQRAPRKRGRPYQSEPR